MFNEHEDFDLDSEIKARRKHCAFEMAVRNPLLSNEMDHEQDNQIV